MFPNERPVEVQHLSDTRWASHVAACNAVWRRFSTLCNLLDNISCGVNQDRACDVLALIDILQVSKSVFDNLQSRAMELTTAHDLIHLAQTSLSDMPNEDSCITM